MGLFRRNDDDRPPTSESDSSGIDFSSYDLVGLSDDIRSIINIPGAIAQTAKFAFALPVIVSIATWVVFSSRMAGWVFVPFLLITFGLAMIGSAAVGAFFITRKRLDLVQTASAQVVDVIGQMHHDVVRVKDGHADTSIQQVAVGLLENAIFPLVFGVITDSAEASLGPLGRLAGRAGQVPMKLVERSVISAVEALPDIELGQLIDSAGGLLPELGDQLARVSSEYDHLRTRLEGIVAKVSLTATRSVLGVALAVSMPLVIWLAIGWLVS